MSDIQIRRHDLNLQFELFGEIRDVEISKKYLEKFLNEYASFKKYLYSYD